MDWQAKAQPRSFLLGLRKQTNHECTNLLAKDHCGQRRGGVPARWRTIPRERERGLAIDILHNRESCPTPQPHHTPRRQYLVHPMDGMYLVLGGSLRRHSCGRCNFTRFLLPGEFPPICPLCDEWQGLQRLQCLKCHLTRNLRSTDEGAACPQCPDREGRIGPGILAFQHGAATKSSNLHKKASSKSRIPPAFLHSTSKR